MRNLLRSWPAILALVVAADVRGDEKLTTSPVEKSAAKPPQATYEHTTAATRLGKFVLKGEKGTADYYYNNRRQQADLVFVRNAELTGDAALPGKVPGWVYQVSNKGKKENFWFFFATDPIKKGDKRYAMYYSVTPPDRAGKQLWIRILTPKGTSRTPLQTDE